MSEQIGLTLPTCGECAASRKDVDNPDANALVCALHPPIVQWLGPQANEQGQIVGQLWASRWPIVHKNSRCEQWRSKQQRSN